MQDAVHSLGRYKFLPLFAVKKHEPDSEKHEQLSHREQISDFAYIDVVFSQSDRQDH